MKNGIDVSEFQGTVDFSKVKASGVSFVILRAGYGKESSQIDKSFAENIAAALSAGLDVGAYWFSYATNEAEAAAEAKLFSKVMKPYLGKIRYPLFYDYEYASYSYSVKRGILPTKRLITDLTKKFLETLRDNGWYGGWYTNLDYYQNRYYPEELREYPLWLAQYGLGADAYPCAMRQISSTGSVPGIYGYVDLDRTEKDFPEIIRKAGKNGLSKPAPEPPVLTVAGSGVRIRSLPSIFGRVLGALSRGTKVIFLSDSGIGWSRIRFGKTEGYMANEFLSGKKLSAYPKALCCGIGVNVRAKPSLSGRVLFQINRGKEFTVRGISKSGWMDALIDGEDGDIYYDPSYIEYPFGK